VFPNCRKQRFWAYKGSQSSGQEAQKQTEQSEERLHEKLRASTKEKALAAYEHIISTWRRQCP
jgi:F0F1-type ATP synthase membrane subunit b/b'